MPDDRALQIVLDNLTVLNGKIDAIAQDVAALRQGSGDLDRRVGRNESDIHTLRTACSEHEAMLRQFGSALSLITKLLVGALLAALGAIVPQVLHLLALVR